MKYPSFSGDGLYIWLVQVSRLVVTSRQSLKTYSAPLEVCTELCVKPQALRGTWNLQASLRYLGLYQFLLGPTKAVIQVATSVPKPDVLYICFAFSTVLFA